MFVRVLNTTLVNHYSLLDSGGNIGFWNILLINSTKFLFDKDLNLLISASLQAFSMDLPQIKKCWDFLWIYSNPYCWIFLFFIFSLIGSDGLPGPRGSLGPKGFDGSVGEKETLVIGDLLGSLDLTVHCT